MFIKYWVIHTEQYKTSTEIFQSTEKTRNKKFILDFPPSLLVIQVKTVSMERDRTQTSPYKTGNGMEGKWILTISHHVRMRKLE